MSVDLLSLGRHNLDVSTVEKTSRQICERLNINIAIGYCSLLYGPTLTSVHNYWKNHSFDYMDLYQQSNVSAF